MENSVLNLKQKQEVSLEILKYVADFCEKNQIRYYLTYGTLLGAIRHKGFIPWDDDIDVFIPRPDYEQLLLEFINTKEYHLLDCSTSKDYVLPFSKVQNIRTKMRLPSGRLIDQGLGIDLFPLDGIPKEIELSEAENIFRNSNMVFRNTIVKFDSFRFINPSSFKDYIKILSYYVLCKSGVLNKTGKRNSINPYNSDYDKCDYVVNAVGIHSGKFRPYSKEWFKPIKVEFEGLKFSCPAGYDRILTMVYSDYMSLPPEEKRVSTHIADYIWI